MRILLLLLLFSSLNAGALSCAEYKGKAIEFEKEEHRQGVAFYFSTPAILEGNKLQSVTLHASLMNKNKVQEHEELLAPLSYKMEGKIAKGWFYIPKGWVSAEVYVSYRNADCGPVVVESVNI